MSAYVVHREHVIYLVDAARQLGGHQGFRWWDGNGADYLRDYDDEHAGEVAQMLWDANLESIAARYPDCGTSAEDIKRRRQRAIMEGTDDDTPGPCGVPFVVGEFPRILHRGSPDLPQVIQSLRCYEYQSCEHAGWEGSRAERFCRALERAVLDRLLAKVGGTDGKTWGAPELVPSNGGPVPIMALSDDRPAFEWKAASQ